MRKFWIHIEMFYQVFNLIFAWFSLVSVIRFVVLGGSADALLG
jgi:chitin synthase